MHVKLWGTRGSVPTPTPETAQYGGNTPCVEVRAPDGERLILDAGIGLHWLGCDLLADGFADGGRAHLLVTHTHWGHIQGLPFFPPMLAGGCTIDLYGCGGDGSFEDLLRRQMARAYCPVPDFFEARVGAEVSTTEIVEQPFVIGGTTITPRLVHHVAGVPTLGFRLDHGDASLAYIPDVEYLDDGHREPALALAAGVDLLIHDAHHTAAEYAAQRGQGHCTDDDAVALAREAGVGKIVLFHHHPDHDDDAIDDVVSGHADADVSVDAAAERTEYVLGST